MRSTRLAPLATTLLLLTLGVVGCSDDTTTEPGSTQSPSTSTTPSESTSESTSESASTTPSDPTEAPEPDRPTIEITFEGDTVTPNGERVAVPLGEEIDLVVTADAPGELHVHSTPEQELAYEAGTSTLPLVIDQPGVVEVESHDLELVVVQLEVR
jgi:cytoskeletal protein RodZ